MDRRVPEKRGGGALRGTRDLTAAARANGRGPGIRSREEAGARIVVV
jgi:hypothetical protein